MCVCVILLFLPLFFFSPFFLSLLWVPLSSCDDNSNERWCNQQFCAAGLHRKKKKEMSSLSLVLARYRDVDFERRNCSLAKRETTRTGNYQLRSRRDISFFSYSSSLMMMTVQKATILTAIILSQSIGIEPRRRFLHLTGVWTGGFEQMVTVTFAFPGMKWRGGKKNILGRWNRDVAAVLVTRERTSVNNERTSVKVRRSN